ncbi:hypothetical protein [Lysobacter sp. Root690]|uniref:hypothetical protein n=1 Tax=Lysobacter sp. Root690 TaxID=1736588 RepID=UPI0006F86C23|nr:hypothetical protein [Lysobacter sp. Root690]KRB08054.1 hypothetical protein ASD86_09680 [Lysobacter sp. Root690]
MPTNPNLQDLYPNRNGIYTPLRKLTSAEIEDQIEACRRLAQRHLDHAEALVAYRDRGFDKSRHGR